MLPWIGWAINTVSHPAVAWAAEGMGPAGLSWSACLAPPGVRRPQRAARRRGRGEPRGGSPGCAEGAAVEAVIVAGLGGWHEVISLAAAGDPDVDAHGSCRWRARRPAGAPGLVASGAANPRRPVLPVGREIAQPTCLLVGEDPCHTCDTAVPGRCGRRGRESSRLCRAIELAERSPSVRQRCAASVRGCPCTRSWSSIDSPTATTASALGMTT